MDYDVCCGKCKYHNCDNDTNEWYCNNEDSVCYTDYTDYADACEDFEER